MFRNRPLGRTSADSHALTCDDSFEPDAEARCIEYLDMAVRVDEAGDETNPEIYSTLASVRLSQQRPSEALRALQKSYSIWSSLPPDAPSVPSFEARLSLVKLFIECEGYDESIEILEGLEDENDEDFEVMYLLGLVNWLIGEEETQPEMKREAYIDSREALERFLQVVTNARSLTCRATADIQLSSDLRTQSYRGRCGNGLSGPRNDPYARERQRHLDQ